LKTSSGYRPTGGVAECKTTADEQAKWKGHLGSLFSPVLKMFGGDEPPGLSNEAERKMAEAEAARAEATRVEAARAEAAREKAEADAAEEEARRQQEEAEQEGDDEAEFDPYLFIKQLPPYHEARDAGDLVVPRLPPRRVTRSTEKPVTLVLDLDETLVHCSVDGGDPSDLVFPVKFNGVEYQVAVKMRPHMDAFLRAVSKKFEVVVFTASQQVYADTLLDIIDPEGELIQHRLFRDSCLLVEGNYLKDLNVLGRDLSKTVLVDNSPHAFGYQVDNGIPIESWFDDPNDRELLKLADFLTAIESAEDVRPLVRAHFKSFELIRDAR